MTLAELLAVALANAQMFQAEQMRRQLAEAIYRVSQTLSAALAPEGVPELILDQAGPGAVLRPQRAGAGR